MMRIVYGFILVLLAGVLLGSLSGCVHSIDRNERSEWDRCSQAFKRINPLLIKAAKDKKVKEEFKAENYVIFIVRRDQSGIVTGFTDFPLTLSKQNLEDLNLISSYFHNNDNDFDVVDIPNEGTRISYQSFGTPMVVYSPERVPDYYFAPDERDPYFNVYKLEKDWYLLRTTVH